MRILRFIIPIILIAACNGSSEKKGDTKDTAIQVTQMPETLVFSDTLFIPLEEILFGQCI